MHGDVALLVLFLLVPVPVVARLRVGASYSAACLRLMLAKGYPAAARRQQGRHCGEALLVSLRAMNDY